MEDYEKLLLFLEAEGVDTSTFLQLKMNESHLLGYRDVFGVNSYLDLLSKKEKLYENTYNPCFLTITGETLPPIDIKDFRFIYHKDESVLKLDDLLINKQLHPYEKDEIIFRGIEIYSNEYQKLLHSFFGNYEDVLIHYNQLLKLDKHKHMKEYKKNNLIFGGIFILMVLFNHFYLSLFDVYRFYSFFYNAAMLFMMGFMFFKLFILSTLKNSSLKQNKINIYDYKARCKGILASHERDIALLEEEITLHGHKDHKLSFHHFTETNQKLQDLLPYVLKRITNNYSSRLNTLTNITKRLNVITWYLIGIVVILSIFL